MSSDDNENNCISRSKDRESPFEFRTYEEELEHRLEHDPSPTESELIRDLENEFDEFEIIEKYKRERKCFLERSASFNSDKNGQQGAFARYAEKCKPKRSSSFCSGSDSRPSGQNYRKNRTDHSIERKTNDSGESRKTKRLVKCKSFDEQLDSSESEDYVDSKNRKRITEIKKREKRKSRKEKRINEETKTVKNEIVDYSSSVTVRKVSEKTGKDNRSTPVTENNGNKKVPEELVPKPVIRNKPAPPPVPARRSFPSKSVVSPVSHKTEVIIPVADNNPSKDTEEKFKAEINVEVSGVKEEKKQGLEKENEEVKEGTNQDFRKEPESNGVEVSEFKEKVQSFEKRAQKVEANEKKSVQPIGINERKVQAKANQRNQVQQIEANVSRKVQPNEINERQKVSPARISESKANPARVNESKASSTRVNENKANPAELNERKKVQPVEVKQQPRKEKIERKDSKTDGQKGALQQLYEEGLKQIQKKHNSESEGDEKGVSDSEPGTDNPFKSNKGDSPTNFFKRRPKTLKIKVGFESPAIGQGLSTPPALANTEEKTLPYFLKTQKIEVEGKVREITTPPLHIEETKNQSKKQKELGRFENNIEYEKYVELGKNLIKVSSLDKSTEKTLQEAEVDRRIIEDQIEKEEVEEDYYEKSPKKSLKKLDITRRIKEPKPDYSNEIREEVEPITPDTDQSEIEEILESFSKELRQSDVNEILNADESKPKRRSSTPKTLRETAFLSSPIVRSDAGPQFEKAPLRKSTSSPSPVSKTRDQVLMTNILRKDGRPNTLPLNNNYGMPDTSLTLENYLDKKRGQYPASGRVSAPLFRESYQSPGYVNGRRSVPVDHQRNEILERGRSLQRMPFRSKNDNQFEDENDNFRRNNLRTRSLTRDASRSYSEPKRTIQNDVIYESRIPKYFNNNRINDNLAYSDKNIPARNSLERKDSGGFTPSEIEAMFWERLKQKKMRAALREQELLQQKLAKPSNFIRNAPERSTIGPIYQKDNQIADRVQLRRNENGNVERSQSALDFVKEPPETPTTPLSDTERKRKKDESKEKGFSLTKIPFFRRRSKSSSKEDSYKRASEDYEDNATSPIFKRGSLVSTSSNEGTDTSSTNLHKKVSFDQIDNANLWPTRNGPSANPPTRKVSAPPNTPTDNSIPSRPLPPLPKETEMAGYGVILRSNKLPPKIPDHSPQTPKSPEYGRISFVEAQRASPLYDTARKSASPNRNMGIIHENELYGNTRLRERELYISRRIGPRTSTHSDTESGSEAGEVQRILHGVDKKPCSGDEEWNTEGKGRGGAPCSDPVGPPNLRDDEVRRLGRPGTRRDDPRRHTLSGSHHQSSSIARSMDLESPLPRGYPPPSSSMLYDDDPGIMSEAETSSTGFRRGGKQRSSLPVVRTPSKTLERPLGLVFLQYRSETKRALLPNEITSIDTVKALFVRSFPKQLTMEYLDSPMVKIYIHDSNKDMFYELEDLRSHLRDIRDRSVLRLFEAADVNGGAGGAVPGGPGLLGPPSWDQDQSYFSEPEFDSEYQHQHIHKSKSSKSTPQSYYMTHSYPPGQGQAAPGSATLPRGGSLLRTYSPAVGAGLPPDRLKAITPSERLHSESGYMSSPERGGTRGYPSYVPPGGSSYEDPYYSQGYGARTGSITPVIDEEARLRVEHMERQLANLTGLVQKALTQTPVVTPRDYLAVPTPRDAYRTPDKSVSFEKSVSFSDEPPDMNSPKQHSPQHSADSKPAKPAIKSSTLPRTSSQERDRHKPPPPPKPVSLSPGQYDNRIVDNRLVYRDLQLTPEMYNQLRGLQKKAKDLRQEMRNLRRMSQAQAHTIREAIRDTFIKIRAMLLAGGDTGWAIEGDKDRLRLSREEELYKQEMIRLEKDLTELESTVEELRGNVINRKTRVNMSDVEDMALILSKSSKTVADLKVRFPGLQEGIKGMLSSEMDRVVREEKFLKEEPERLENALRRCKKLTGTLVTLKRLASVQEQRLPSTTGESRLSPPPTDTPPVTPPALAHTKPSSGVSASGVVAAAGRDDSANSQRPENALDALLDELQTFARPPNPPQSPNSSRPPSMSEIGRRKGSIDSNNPPLSNLPVGTSSLRRLHSYPSSSDDSSPPVQTRESQKPATGPKPPVPERNAELLSQLANRRVPPPPPPRTSSRSPLASPTSPSLPPRSVNPPSQPQMGINTGTLRRNTPGRSSLREPLKAIERRASAEEGFSSAQNTLGVPALATSTSNSSSCESVNSQEGMKSKESRKEQLEQRHQELLRKQKALQEQYARLQQLQRGTTALAIPTHDLILKKTGSESNLLAKMGLGQNLTAAAPMSGSLTHLAPQNQAPLAPLTAPANPPTSTTKVYETDIL